MTPSENEIKELEKSLDNIKKNISTLKLVIDRIIYNLNGCLRMFRSYYEIANDIIKKYKLFNKKDEDKNNDNNNKNTEKFRNYTILKSLRNLKFSNNKILRDLNKIIEEKIIQNQSNLIIDIYKKKKDKYKGNESTNEINEESDESWIKEIDKKEEKSLITPMGANKKKN